MSTIPLYVRAGAVIPLDPVRQYSDEPVSGPLTLTVYPGASATSAMYEGDGRSFEHERGDFMRLEMRWQDQRRTLQLSLARGSRMRPPRSLVIDVRRAGAPDTRTVKFDGSAQTVTL